MPEHKNKLLLACLFIFSLLSIISSSHAFATGNDGCEGMIRVRNSSTAKLPVKYRKYERPWLKQFYSSYLYKSTALTYNWSWFKELKIQGLDSTLSNIIQLLDHYDCFFVAYGKGVKNILIGAVKDRSLLEISGETTCDAFTLYNICKTHFGHDNCGVSPITSTDTITMGNSNVLKMFDEVIIGPITLLSWGSTYEPSRLKWSFSVNHGGIFDDGFGNTSFIDVTGQSQQDICFKRIVIPTQPSYWQAWCSNSLVKTLEFFNLVADGFNANRDVHELVTASITKSFDPHVFQKYYCNSVLGGEYIPSQRFSSTRPTALCRYLRLDVRRKRLMTIINNTMHEDFGNFWHENVTAALAKMYHFETHGISQRTITITYEKRINPAKSYTYTYYRHPYVPSPTQSTYTTTTTTTITKAVTNFNYNQPPKVHETTPVVHAVKYYRADELSQVRWQDVPYVPNFPPKTDPTAKLTKSNGRNPDLKVVYFRQDELPQQLAEDY